MKEADRRGSSCPVLFCVGRAQVQTCHGCDRRGGGGPLVHAHAAQHAQPGEWIKVDGARLAPVNGKMSLRFMEPMEEVNYIDQLRLVAVDHPENVEVNPDERFS